MTALRFHPNCYQVATGSEDNSVKMWDLRKRSCVYTVPAHTKLISDIKFETEYEGRIMVTTGYDNKCKIWSTGDWILVRTLVGGHDNKVTSSSHTKDLQYIITTSFDRTFKLWKPISQ
jgi:U4/U6 small nuclear ribonucleoprotein PRP4